MFAPNNPAKDKEVSRVPSLRGTKQSFIMMKMVNKKKDCFVPRNDDERMFN